LSLPYQSAWKLLKRYVMPFFAGVTALYLIVAVASHVLFEAMHSYGLYCNGTRGELPKDSGTGKFDNTAMCHPTGVELTKGVKYRITLKVDEHVQWRDASLPAPIGGFTPDSKLPLHMQVFAPFRRYVAEPWFKPIARIGRKGTDEYPLENAGVVTADPTRTLVSEITARSDGELFIFVNDAVFAAPRRWHFTYGNNEGTAVVTVEPVRRAP
jgi:hypothetical protein